MADWNTGWPHDADDFDMVEVEYASGELSVAQVCEIDWSQSNDADPYSPAPGEVVVRWRLVSAPPAEPVERP